MKKYYNNDISHTHVLQTITDLVFSGSRAIKDVDTNSPVHHVTSHIALRKFFAWIKSSKGKKSRIVFVHGDRPDSVTISVFLNVIKRDGLLDEMLDHVAGFVSILDLAKTIYPDIESHSLRSIAGKCKSVRSNCTQHL